MDNFTELLHQWVQKINDPMWTGLVYVLLGAGLFFTLADRKSTRLNSSHW